jgi:GTP-binding protein HflX
VVRDADGEVNSVAVSAHSGEGLDLLAGAIAGFFQRRDCQGWIRLDPAEGRARAQLYDSAQVLAEEHGADGSHYLHIRVSRDRLARLGIDPQRLVEQPHPDAPVAALQ